MYKYVGILGTCRLIGWYSAIMRSSQSDNSCAWLTNEQKYYPFLLISKSTKSCHGWSNFGLQMVYIELNFSTAEERKTYKSWIAQEWENNQDIFIFWMNYSFHFWYHHAHCFESWLGWWSRALLPSLKLQLQQQDLPVCDQTPAPPPAETLLHPDCVQPYDNGSDSFYCYAHWSRCCRHPAPLALMKHKTEVWRFSKFFWFTEMCMFVCSL